MKNLFKLPAVAAVTAALLINSTAFADSTNSQGVLVANLSQQSGYNQLRVQLKDGTLYFANPGQGAPGCGIPEATLETAKVWLSMAHTAVMSGRNVMIYYTPCGGNNWITAIDLGP